MGYLTSSKHRLLKDKSHGAAYTRPTMRLPILPFSSSRLSSSREDAQTRFFPPTPTCGGRGFVSARRSDAAVLRALIY